MKSDPALNARLPWVLPLLAIIACPAHSVAQDESGIMIRIHVPYPERLENELSFWYVIRIENRGTRALPLLTNPAEGPDDLLQFCVVGSAGGGQPEPEAPNWEKIVELADGKVEPGEAVELIGVKGGDLNSDGDTEIALQISPDSFVYSNTVSLRALPIQAPDHWPVIAKVQMTPGEVGWSEFLAGTVNEEGRLYIRNVYNDRFFRQILTLPGDEMPRIVADPGRSQAAFIFDRHPEATRYFNARLSLTRTTPWPSGNDASWFINKPMPVDAPSPLEFPLSLFGDGRPDLPVAGTLAPSASGREPTETLEEAQQSSAGRQAVESRTWPWLASTGAFVLLVLLVVVRNLRNKSSRPE